MKRGFNKRIKLIFIGSITIGLFIFLNLRAFSQDMQYSHNLFGADKLILIIIDFKDFFCPLCLESLKNFCEALYSKKEENLAVGVLIFENPDDEENIERFIRIIEKQLRGFVIGNNIKFPIILDRFHIFKELNLEDSDIILFHLPRKLLKKYTFPLTNKQLDEILFLR